MFCNKLQLENQSFTDDIIDPNYVLFYVIKQNKI